MATKEKETNKELEVGEIVSKSEQFIENNSKKIIYGIVALAIIIGAVLGIKHVYMEPQEKKAAAAMFKGELYFDRDSFALALNGNGADYEGFEAIIDQYGNTDAGNLAKAYAGICYYNMGEPEKALDLLKSFKGHLLFRESGQGGGQRCSKPDLFEESGSRLREPTAIRQGGASLHDHQG